MGIMYLSMLLHDYKFSCVLAFFCLMVASIGISILLSLIVIFANKVKYMVHVWMIPFYMAFKIYSVFLFLTNFAVIWGLIS